MDVDWPLEVIARHVKRHLSEHSTALVSPSSFVLPVVAENDV